MTWLRAVPRIKEYTGADPSKARLVVRAGAQMPMGEPDPKVIPRRSVKYRRWVASLQCAHCGKVGQTQCAHADFDKGMGTKTSDETCFPLCVACHAGIGSEGWFEKESRRALEEAYGLRTRLAAISCGHWPRHWYGN